MPTFYAVLKLTPTARPVTTGEFEALDVEQALRVMLMRAQVRSTMEVHEYELLRVQGRNYERVGRKSGSVYEAPTKPASALPALPPPAAPVESTLFSTYNRRKTVTL